MNKTIKTKELPPQTTFGAEIINGLQDFFDHVESGGKMTIRTVALELNCSDFKPTQIQKLRSSLQLSQAIMAKLLGVSATTLQSWEQGKRKPSRMAQRFLHEIAGDSKNWRNRLLRQAKFREKKNAVK